MGSFHLFSPGAILRIELGVVGTATVVAVAFTGYWIFKNANGEENDFRNGRNPKSRSLVESRDRS